jgi:orotate phosphoribosyltransferase-like protein
MNKDKVKHLTGVFASMFAHAGHITKEEAKEISGMTDHEFDKAYNKAAVIADNVLKSGDRKMAKFLDHFAKEIEKDIEGFGEKIF